MDHGNQHYVLDEMKDDDSTEILGSAPTSSASDAVKSKIFYGYLKQNTSCKCHNDRPNPEDCINLLDEASRSRGTVKSQSLPHSTESIGVKFNTNELRNLQKI
ncbi:conserved hypothetical protein [Ricinus communis]|uniref:Uncharacterized protein n=1 Tax=Ricinus communis TaxID=3988 RepID=B9RZH4_RICCO|nr:conserved hypothetical protein [Ricinus communis]